MISEKVALQESAYVSHHMFMLWETSPLPLPVAKAYGKNLTILSPSPFFI